MRISSAKCSISPKSSRFFSRFFAANLSRNINTVSNNVFSTSAISIIWFFIYSGEKEKYFFFKSFNSDLMLSRIFFTSSLFSPLTPVSFFMESLVNFRFFIISYCSCHDFTERKSTISLSACSASKYIYGPSISLHISIPCCRFSCICSSSCCK